MLEVFWNWGKATDHSKLDHFSKPIVLGIHHFKNWPYHFDMVPQSANPEDVTPFGTGKIVLSIGMGIVALLSIPLGYWNLDDNIIVQNVALMVIILSPLGFRG